MEKVHRISNQQAAREFVLAKFGTEAAESFARTSAAIVNWKGPDGGRFVQAPEEKVPDHATLVNPGWVGYRLSLWYQ